MDVGESCMMLFIVGPTAVGKSEIAAEVASRIDAEIIGADAFQVYAGLEILTAKPNRRTLEKARHHLIGDIPITRSFDVAQFAAQAKLHAAEIAARGRHVLVVGGTGLYVRALTHGLSDLPRADARVRAELEDQSLTDLQMRYAALDPNGANLIDLKNKRRLVRALEICLLTGKPSSSFRKEWNQSPAPSVGFFLKRERDDLNQRIETRVQQMFENGLLNEVTGIHEIGVTAAQVLGLREARACLRSEISEAEAIAEIAQATRRYAKRQLTWFRRESMFEPLNLSTLSPESAIEAIVRRVRARPALADV